MYAIVEIKGEQFKVGTGSPIYSPLTGKDVGESIIIDKVLFVKGDNNDSIIGDPYIPNAKVTGVIDKMIKAKKINIFKYKRRKNHHKRKGFRAKLHKITIKNIEL